MFAYELPIERALDVPRIIRKMGAHRYIAGKLIIVHAFAAEHCIGLADWARRVMESNVIDLASRDECLYTQATEADVADILEAFWSNDAAHDRLHARLEAAELEVAGGEPFDPEDDDATHPLLIDAGWELVRLVELDAERHKGAIAAFGDPVLYEGACFDERESIEPIASLQELPAIGARELLFGARDGALAAPFVVWIEGNPTYHDYVLRGVLRAAKIAE